MNGFVAPVDRALLASVARRYFVHDETKVQIARDLGVSRFKVARMLDQARDEGIVRIEIEDASDLDLELARRLQQALKLRHAVVLDAGGEIDVALRSRTLARLAAIELSRTIGPDDVLGLPWSRSVGLTVAALSSLPKVPVVQLTGALTAVDHDSPVDIVRDAARIGGGQAYHFYAPLVASDADSAATFRRQPTVAAALQKADEVTVAIVGIGAWAPGRSTLYEWADAYEHDQLSRAGVAGEVCGVFIDEAGAAITADLTKRVITVTDDQLRRIPRVIGVVFGADRADAVLAAHRAGFVDVLVVDDHLARRLLERLDGEAGGRGQIGDG